MMDRALPCSIALVSFAAALIAGCSDSSTPPPPPPKPQPVVYQLPAVADTTITIAVKAGQTLQITATGTVCTNPGGPVADCDMWTDANGIPSCHYVNDAWQCRGLPFMALIGRRVGHHQYFLVGTDYMRDCDSDGELKLMVNDWVFGDNAGAFTISVQRK
jgi:hypothetical protein